MRYQNFLSSWFSNILFFLVLFFTIITFVLWSIVFFNTNEKSLEVVFLDVGQGDAIFIETEKGTQVLIDGGRGRGVLRELSKVMPFWDRSIDIVVATHPDADHIGGLTYVLNRFNVDQILEAGIENDTPVFHALEVEIKEEGADEILPSRGTHITLDGTTVLTLLSRNVVSASNTNDASIIIRLDYKDTSFLFTGDAGKEVERELLQFHNILDVDVLKVGHHGSDTSTSDEFLSATSPDFAIISVGSDNSYGHPDENVLERLSASGADIFRTDTDGTVRLISNGEVIVKKDLGFFEQLFGI